MLKNSSLTLSSASASISPNTTAATSASWSNNGITWTASRSGEASGYPYYNAFNDNISQIAWASPFLSYNSTTGLSNNNATTALVSGETMNSLSSIPGQWLQIQSNTPVIMKTYSIGYQDDPITHPRTFYIVGSNDGTNWYPIQYCTTTNTNGSVYTSGTYTGPFNVSSTMPQNGFTTINTYGTSSNSYTYFRFIVNSIFPNGTVTYCKIEELLIVFTMSSVYSVSMSLDNNVANQLNIDGNLALSKYINIVTPNTTAATSNSWSNNNVNWTASASSAYKAASNGFSNLTNEPWSSSSLKYNSTGGYIGTVTTIVANGASPVQGEWLQIQSSIPLVFQNYSFNTQYNIPNSLAKTYSIVGSSDGITWYYIHDGAFTAWPGNQLSTYTTATQYTGLYNVATATNNSIQNSNNTINNTSVSSTFDSYKSLSYTYFRLIVKSICVGSFGASSSSSGYAVLLWNCSFGSASSISVALDNTTANQLNISGNVNLMAGVTRVSRFCEKVYSNNTSVTTSYTFDVSVSGTIMNLTAGAQTANFAINLINIPSDLNQTFTVTILSTGNFFCNSVSTSTTSTVGATTVAATPKWIGASAPSISGASYVMQSITIINNNTTVASVILSSANAYA